MSIKVKLLGSGTSFGVPVPGCKCKTCQSSNPRNKRSRNSLYIESEKTKILIDTSKDLWAQFLQHNIDDVDTVFYTHAHADHVLGIDDLRCVNVKWNKSIHLCANKETMKTLKTMFPYIFKKAKDAVSSPVVSTEIFQNKKKLFKDISVETISVDHKCMLVNAYIINEQLAYVTDVKNINASGLEKLANIPHLFLGCIRFQEHPNHLNLNEALNLIDKIHPGKTYLIHTSHTLEYDEVNAILPEHVEMGYDGLEFELSQK